MTTGNTHLSTTVEVNVVNGDTSIDDISIYAFTTALGELVFATVGNKGHVVMKEGTNQASSVRRSKGEYKEDGCRTHRVERRRGAR